MEQGNRHRVALESEIAMRHANIALEHWVKERAAIAAHMAGEWETMYADDHESFRRSALLFIDSFPGIQAINWINADWRIRIIVPVLGNEPALEANLREHPNPLVVTSITRALQSGVGIRRRVKILSPTHKPVFVEAIHSLMCDISIDCVFRAQFRDSILRIFLRKTQLSFRPTFNWLRRSSEIYAASR